MEPREPDWVNRLSERVEEFLELQGPGTIEIRWKGRERQLLFAPGLLELVGGSEDGETVHPYFSLNLVELAAEFDEPPSMDWNTMYDEIWLSGLIGGEDVFLIFRKAPFPGLVEPSHVLDGDKLRKRN